MPEPEESIAVEATSVEETPKETPEATETPAEKVEEGGSPAESTEELFELPDGRKVDAATLSKEWKENFYPDYTRKSQELAKVKTNPEPLQDKPAETYYKDPNWQPKTYAEIIEAAKLEIRSESEKEELQKAEHIKAVETEVMNQLTEIKAIDPNLNENALFLHANKYGFRDLKAAHANMKDMSEVIKKTQTTTAQNIAKRNDPVSVAPGATGGGRPDPSAFENAVDYLRSLK